MKFKTGLLAIVLLLSTAPLKAEPGSKTLAERITSRTFPSVFQAWNEADNIRDEDRWTTLARHDLVFHAPDFFGMKWAGEYLGLSTSFTADSQKRGQQTRKMLLGKNPNLIMLAELRYRDAHRSHLPDNHPWWARKNGKPVIGWEEGGYFLLDFSNSNYQKQVALQARAIVESGVFDGIMLDWWDDNDDRLSLVRAIRAAIGEEALILVNANDRQTPKTAAFVNGYFMECYRSKTVAEWGQITTTLQWAEKNLREPRINCLETWYHESRDDLQLMRATTTLSLTLSDGYCLFSDPNPLPTPDHLHNWYAFWNRSLGHPSAKGQRERDGSIQREYERGLAVYNPPGNPPVTVEFKLPRMAVSSQKRDTRFTVSEGDGEIFLTE